MIRSLGIIGFAGLLLFSPPLVRAQSATAVGTNLAKIHVAKDGRTLVTGRGKPFVPFGVNYYRPGTGWAPQVWKKFDAEATRRDFARMKELGVNCVRVFLSYGSFYMEPGVLKPEGLAKFDQFLALAEAMGIYVHPTGPDHWEEVPDWARGDRIADEKVLSALESFWKLFAARYRGRPVIFAYDLRNEPEVSWDNAVMNEKWNRWLEQKYGSAGKLTQSWNATNKTLQLGRLPAPEPKDAAGNRELLDYQLFREEVADAWTHRQVAAIKSVDPDALVTVGLIQWSVPSLLPRVQHYSGFRPERQARLLDFLEIHFYPLERGAFEYRNDEEELRNLAYLESVVREVARPGKPVVVAEFGWYGGGKPTFDRGTHPAASEEQQARWCGRVIETTAGLANGWLNWGFYDQPEATDVSQLTGLLTRDGKLKAWGREFKKLADRFQRRQFATRKSSPRPALDWPLCLTSVAAGNKFREEYYQAFRSDESTRPHSASAKATPNTASAPRRVALARVQLQRLHRALEPLHRQYHPSEQMLRQPLSSPGYHTTLTNGFVHPTSASLNYAVALLDTGDDELRKRAEAILLRVIALQDPNPGSKTYGIWPWFLEEPLDKMSPPDWNWADFCGTALVQIAFNHRERLSPDLRPKVHAAILHAARSIQRRNVGPSYTNIAIMGTYVTLVAAELYGLEDLRDYALARWRRFYEYTKHHGAFTEYNSPPYTVVALRELGRLRLHAKDPEARRLTEELYRLAWQEIAHHFHPPTRQWAGPHSRCYSTLLRPEVLGLIERATEGRVSFGVDEPTLDESRLPLLCPRDLERFFSALDTPRDFRETFVKSEPPVVGTTHLEPAFALGSINRGDLWNQRRSLLAYWGNAKRPSYLQVRFLHDGYDFAAAQFFSVQQGGSVLAGINFAVDGGDRHPSLDKIKNAMIKAKDLRLRFEFGVGAGEGEFIAPATLAEAAQLCFGELQVQLDVPYAVLADARGRWQAGKESDKAFLDVVLYSGEERTFHLAELNEAAVGFALRLSTSDERPRSVGAAVRDGRLQMRWESLQLALPVRPGRAGDLQQAFKASISQ